MPTRTSPSSSKPRRNTRNCSSCCSTGELKPCQCLISRITGHLKYRFISPVIPLTRTLRLVSELPTKRQLVGRFGGCKCNRGFSTVTNREAAEARVRLFISGNIDRRQRANFRITSLISPVNQTPVSLIKLFSAVARARRFESPLYSSSMLNSSISRSRYCRSI